MSPDLCATLEQVRGRILDACRRGRRDPAEVRLVAVSKTVAAERVRQAVSHGQRIFGENRVQEALTKIAEVGAGAEWHMVGHLQRNKARVAVGKFALIHGVDSARLAGELDRRAQAAGLRQAILLQLNLSHEASKSGADEQALGPLIDVIAPLEHLELRGLMTIPPVVERAEQSRRWFARLRELRDVAQRRLGRTLPDLSMGMTDDFEVAIEEGATLVRVGRAIFGARP